VLKIIAPGRCLFVARFFYNEREPIKIYSELCQMKSLDNYISCYRNILSLETKMSLIYRTALGIRFLRDYGIIHNDLKPQNVLLKYMATKKQGYFFPRLIDFGESQEIPHRGKRKTLPEFRRGYTVPYAPPEQVTSNHYSEKTDVYSLGVMIIEYVFGYFPLEMVRLGK
jgi:serine/threonine protein kinase